MGLSFKVGRPSDIFMEPFDATIAEELEAAFGEIPRMNEGEAYCSDEVPWPGYALLVERAASRLGEEAVPHLLAVGAWQGAFLPIEVDPDVLDIPGTETPLEVGCLAALIRELEAVAAAEGWPTADAELEPLYASARDRDDDDSWSFEVFCQLLITARVAIRQSRPLWVVK